MEYQAKLNEQNALYGYIVYISSFQGSLQPPVILFLNVLHYLVHQQIYTIFHNLLELHSALSEKKIFVTNSAFLTESQFFVDAPILFVEPKYKLWKKRDGINNEKFHANF